MLRYGFFDSEITGYDEEGMPEFDRAESSDFLAMFISQIISDGVLAAPPTCFQVLAGGGMKLKLQPGFGIVRGHFAYSDEEIEVVLDPAPKNYKRIDRIILRLNNPERMCEIVKMTGTPDSAPQPPELIRPATGDYYELCLATVSVNSNQTEISQANITDTRADSSVCGFVTQVIDRIDTSVFYAQFLQFYKEFVEMAGESHSEWVASMQAYLDGLQASGNSQLQGIVDSLESFEAASKSDFLEWFDQIRAFVQSLENGELLLRIKSYFDELTSLVTDDEIDAMIAGSYEKEETAGLFEITSEADIDAIVAGTYELEPEDNGSTPEGGE